ncbi:hypothetical protein HPB50_007231 [Hyalomma asiaticum]|uniref:Uncharacterized protein n=1 Tax=Hyalomma asiaticum TaxID=266040 RepID=A0ACB7STG8_HYAAI|nr:hypothetical protein HPB50_007231 [Hyalomma asiaticum]
MWQANMEQKPSIALYRAHKTTISAERLYENSIGSALLFETRAEALYAEVYRLHFDPSLDKQNTEHTTCAPVNQIAPHYPRLHGNTISGSSSHNTSVPTLAATSITKARLLKWWYSEQSCCSWMQ